LIFFYTQLFYLTHFYMNIHKYKLFYLSLNFNQNQFYKINSAKNKKEFIAKINIRPLWSINFLFYIYNWMNIFLILKQNHYRHWLSDLHGKISQFIGFSKLVNRLCQIQKTLRSPQIETNMINYYSRKLKLWD
jgi:hypothetical protein